MVVRALDFLFVVAMFFLPYTCLIGCVAYDGSIVENFGRIRYEMPQQ